MMHGEYDRFSNFGSCRISDYAVRLSLSTESVSGSPEPDYDEVGGQKKLMRGGVAVIPRLSLTRKNMPHVDRTRDRPQIRN